MYDDKSKGKLGDKVQEETEFLKNNGKQSKKRGKGKGKKQNHRNNGKGININKGVKFNDISFYNKNKLITDSFAKLPFNFIIGGSLAGQTYTVPMPVTTLISFIVDWFQSVDNGLNNDTNTPSQNKSILDQVATIIYTRMRRANAGATNNIEYVDPIISNLMASIDILANAVSMKRVFRCANSFSWKNRLVPQDIFDELGIDYQDFIAHQALYRGKFNTLVALARTIKTLKDFPFINAICAEFENIFKDEDTDTGREELVIPIKGFHHIYDPVGTENLPGGMVRLMTFKDIGETSSSVQAKSVICTGPVSTESTIRKFSLDLKILEAQIYALINDNDFNLIQADIEKAFGEQSGYMVMDIVEENVEPIKPIFSGEFAYMFSNGRFYPTTSFDKTTFESENDGNYVCIQNNSYVNTLYQTHDTQGTVRLKSWLQIKSNTNQVISFMQNTSYINSDSHDPTVDDVIIATRYQSLLSSGNVNAAPTDFRYTGTLSSMESMFYGMACSNFICFGGRIRTLVYSSGIVYNSQRIMWSNSGTIDNSNAATIPFNAIQVLGAFSQLSFAPMFLYPIYSPTSTPIGLFGKINNIRMTSRQELKPIHEAIFLSLWNLPESTNI